MSETNLSSSEHTAPALNLSMISTVSDLSCLDDSSDNGDLFAAVKKCTFAADRRVKELKELDEMASVSPIRKETMHEKKPKKFYPTPVLDEMERTIGNLRAVIDASKMEPEENNKKKTNLEKDIADEESTGTGRDADDAKRDVTFVMKDHLKGGSWTFSLDMDHVIAVLASEAAKNWGVKLHSGFKNVLMTLGEPVADFTKTPEELGYTAGSVITGSVMYLKVADSEDEKSEAEEQEESEEVEDEDNGSDYEQ